MLRAQQIPLGDQWRALQGAQKFRFAELISEQQGCFAHQGVERRFVPLVPRDDRHGDQHPPRNPPETRTVAELFHDRLQLRFRLLERIEAHLPEVSLVQFPLVPAEPLDLGQRKGLDLDDDDPKFRIEDEDVRLTDGILDDRVPPERHRFPIRERVFDRLPHGFLALLACETEFLGLNKLAHTPRLSAGSAFRRSSEDDWTSIRAWTPSPVKVSL